MTRYSKAEAFLYEGCLGDDRRYSDTLDYLRDLKASHDRLYGILAMNDCGKQSCEVCSSNREDLKAAEALR